MCVHADSWYFSTYTYGPSGSPFPTFYDNHLDIRPFSNQTYLDHTFLFIYEIESQVLTETAIASICIVQHRSTGNNRSVLLVDIELPKPGHERAKRVFLF